MVPAEGLYQELLDVIVKWDKMGITHWDTIGTLEVLKLYVRESAIGLYKNKDAKK